MHAATRRQSMCIYFFNFPDLTYAQVLQADAFKHTCSGVLTQEMVTKVYGRDTASFLLTTYLVVPL